MSKKRKSNPQVVNLSPEKYIKTQARKLPVFECLINHDWEENKMCNILITRQHKNGNYTSGVYLVDLYCLGVKDAECSFNKTPYEYKEFKDEYFPDDIFETVEYSLVHNIIMAGLEFANDYGFQPCKEFKSRAQYILDEDTDDIELIEIECGKNNKPLILAGTENQEESKRAFNHLNSTVGPGEFYYSEMKSFGDMDDDDDDELYDEEDEFDEEDELLLEDYIYEDPLKERLDDIERLKKLSDVSKHTREEDAIDLLYISKRLFYNYYGQERIEELRDKYLNFLNVDLDDSSIPSELSGTTIKEHDEKIEDIVYDLLYNDQIKKNKIKGLASNYPEIPFFSFAHLIEMSSKDLDDKKFRKKLNEYCSIYPNYLPLKLFKDQDACARGEQTKILSENLITEKTLRDIFNGRTSIHPYEFLTFHTALFIYLTKQKDILGMDALISSSNQIYPELKDDCIEKELLSELKKVEFCNENFVNS